MKFLRSILWIFLFLILTIITQVGGIILILAFLLFRLKGLNLKKGIGIRILKAGIFISLYLAVSLLLLPPLAKLNNRVPLPVYSNPDLKPLNMGTVLLNRHYVTPDLLNTIASASKQIQEEYPGTVTAYLDANFPFFEGVPLLPHLSHDDGKKLDLAFYYKDISSNKMLNKTSPSWIGYGGYELPDRHETDMPAICESKGFWQYSLLEYFVVKEKKMKFDQERTRRLIEILSHDRRISKIFIEPHLKERMNLKSNNVRFHGCHAVRHDDHIHIQTY